MEGLSGSLGRGSSGELGEGPSGVWVGVSIKGSIRRSDWGPSGGLAGGPSGVPAGSGQVY